MIYIECNIAFCNADDSDMNIDRLKELNDAVIDLAIEHGMLFGGTLELKEEDDDWLCDDWDCGTWRCVFDCVHCHIGEREMNKKVWKELNVNVLCFLVCHISLLLSIGLLKNNSDLIGLSVFFVSFTAWLYFFLRYWEIKGRLFS